MEHIVQCTTLPAQAGAHIHRHTQTLDLSLWIFSSERYRHKNNNEKLCGRSQFSWTLGISTHSFMDWIDHKCSERIVLPLAVSCVVIIKYYHSLTLASYVSVRACVCEFGLWIFLFLFLSFVFGFQFLFSQFIRRVFCLSMSLAFLVASELALCVWIVF